MYKRIISHFKCVHFSPAVLKCATISYEDLPLIRLIKSLVLQIPAGVLSDVVRKSHYRWNFSYRL